MIIRDTQPSLWVAHGRASKAPYNFILNMHEDDLHGAVLGACRVDVVPSQRVRYSLDDPSGVDPATWSVMEPEDGFIGVGQLWSASAL